MRFPGRQLRLSDPLRTAATAGLLALVAVNVASAPIARTGQSQMVPTSAAVGGPFVGVWTSGPYAAEAAALDDLNAGWARVTVIWSTIEPSRGSFSWDALDQSMALASGNRRRTVLAMVRNNPDWAAASRCMLTTDAERAELASFASQLASRYQGVVWQLYNEMDNTSPAQDALVDLGGCFGTVSADGTPTADGAVQYARTIETFSTAVRNVDPGAQVAAGGVASGNFVSASGGAFDRGFLPAVLVQLKLDNSLASLDYVDVHFYSSQGFQYATTGIDLTGRLNQLRQDELAAGLTPDELKPVISDEVSYTDAIGTSTADPSDAFNLAQAAYVPKLLSRAAASQMRAVLWFWLRDATSGLGSDNAYGLIDIAGDPKPSYAAFRYFASLITRADQFVGPLDLSQVSSDLEAYSFNSADGRNLQLMWANKLGADGASLTVTPSCPIAQVHTVSGDSGAFDAASNSLLIGTEPRYIFCSA